VTTDFSESDAQRLADRGRDALIERLRPAFYETAREHADILKLDDEQIEDMIQRAADRADGLQWRRALAALATEELGLSLGEALSSPVVARAQKLADAPSYEESLAALGLDQPAARSAAPASPAAGETTVAEDEAAAPPAPNLDDAAVAEDEPVSDAEPAAKHEIEVEPEPAGLEEDDERVPAADGTTPESLRLDATHLGGIATLEAGEPDLELRIGAHGLDIARKPGRVLGRLRWREIRTLEVQTPRGLRRRRRGERAHLVIRTQHGDASFEVPTSEAALQEQLAPLIAQYAEA
jgi:hypothetical protein